MGIKWKKLLFRLVGINYLTQEASKLIQHVKAELKIQLVHYILKLSVWLLMIFLVIIALFFGLLALGYYLNERLYSHYQGFLIVSAGCLGIIVLLLGIWKLSTSYKKDSTS